MLEFLIDNIFFMFSGCVFPQTIGIPIVTVRPSRRIFTLFVRDVIKAGASEQKRKKPFNSTFRYIDDVLAQTYSYFEDFIYCEGQLRTKLYQAKYEFYKVHNYDFKSFSMVSSVTSAVILFLSVALYELGTGNALLGS